MGPFADPRTLRPSIDFDDDYCTPREVPFVTVDFDDGFEW